MDQATIDKLIDHVTRLEEECRSLRRQSRNRWRAGGSALVLVALVIMIGAEQNPGEPKTIQAGVVKAGTVETDQLIIRGGRGMIASLGGDPTGGSVLALRNPEGLPLLTLGVGKSSAYIYVGNSVSKKRMTISVQGDKPSIELSDEENVPPALPADPK